MFNIEEYINYNGELMVGMRVAPSSSYSHILSRGEAEKLVADLTRALSSSDRQVEADEEETPGRSSCCDGQCGGIRSRCEVQGEFDEDDRSSRLTSQGHYDPWL